MADTKPIDIKGFLENNKSNEQLILETLLRIEKLLDEQNARFRADKMQAAPKVYPVAQSYKNKGNK